MSAEQPRPLMHRIRLVALGTAAVAAAFVVAPVANAAADPSPVGIGVAHTDNFQRGVFEVAAWTEATGETVTSVTATIRDGATTITTRPLVDEHNGFWTIDTSNPLKLAADGGAMPDVGRYAIDVAAQDSLGNTATRTDAGTLDFTLRPVFTTADGSLYPAAGFTNAISRSTPNTGVTGFLKGVVPGSPLDTPELVPLSGRDVTVTQNYTDPSRADTSKIATTLGDGSFQSDPFDQDADADYEVSFNADDAQVHGADSEGGAPDLVPTTVSISASVNRTRAEPGQLITISGTAYDGTDALPDAAIELSLDSYTPGPRKVVTTDIDGHFTGTLTAVYGYGTWSAVPQGFYLTGAGKSGQIVIPEDSAFVRTGIQLAANGRVSAHGELIDPYQTYSSIYGETVRLEYSKDGTTNWKLIAKGTTSYGSVQLSGWGYVAGYYRLYHPTSNTLAHAVTTPVHLSRTETRIANNNASPEPVRKGATVTVTGTLQEYRSGAWHAMGGRPIYLYFQPAGSTRWTWIASGRTDTHGHASLRGKASGDGRWLLQYFGDSTHFDSYGVADPVDVR